MEPATENAAEADKLLRTADLRRWGCASTNGFVDYLENGANFGVRKAKTRGASACTFRS
jgi:hypothetical protein